MRILLVIVFSLLTSRAFAPPTRGCTSLLAFQGDLSALYVSHALESLSTDFFQHANWGDRARSVMLSLDNLANVIELTPLRVRELQQNLAEILRAWNQRGYPPSLTPAIWRSVQEQINVDNFFSIIKPLYLDMILETIRMKIMIGNALPSPSPEVRGIVERSVREYVTLQMLRLHFNSQQ